MKKVFKTIGIVVWVLLLIFFGWLAFNYLYNENTIEKYEEHDYSQDVELLTNTSLLESYIPYYNNGNIHYQQGEFEEAKADYLEALEHNPPHQDEECDIRVNLALAIIATLPEDYDAPENVEASIATLEEAKQYLLEEDCAKDDGQGHDKDAQKLKDEIDKLIEQLKQQDDGGGSDNTDTPTSPNDKPESEDEEEEIKEELMEIQQNSIQEREEELELYEEIDTNGNYDWDAEIW